MSFLHPFIMLAGIAVPPPPSPAAQTPAFERKAPPANTLEIVQHGGAFMIRPAVRPVRDSERHAIELGNGLQLDPRLFTRRQEAGRAALR